MKMITLVATTSLAALVIAGTAGPTISWRLRKRGSRRRSNEPAPGWPYDRPDG